MKPKVVFNREKIIARLQKAAADATAINAMLLLTEIKKNLNTTAGGFALGLQPSPVGSPPANQTGNLLRSIQAVDVTTDPNKPHWKVGTNVVYARIQEWGGVIRPKHSKYLTVPMGVDGRRAARESKGNIYALDLKVVKTPKGLFLAKYVKAGFRVAKGLKIKTKPHVAFLFKLMKQVILPPRPYFRPAIAKTKEAMNTRNAKAVLWAFKGTGRAA